MCVCVCLIAQEEGARSRLSFYFIPLKLREWKVKVT